MNRPSGKKTKQKISVAIISRAVFPFHGYGGLERHVYHQLRHLTAAGCSVTLVTESPRKEIQSISANIPGDVEVQLVEKRLIPLPVKKGFIILDRILNYPLLSRAMAKSIIMQIKENRIDLVYAHGLTAWGITRLRKKLRLDIPIIVNPHGMEEFKNINFLKKLAYIPFRRKMLFAARNADRVVATDEVMIPQVIELLRVNPEKVILLPNAVDIEEARSLIDKRKKDDLRKRYGISGDALLFLSVGRLEANKGFGNLIDQLNRVGKKIDAPWKLLIAGTGSMRIKIEEKIRKYKLSNKVCLIGSISDSDLHNLYDLADIFILPSLYEGSSITTIEAMVHKNPVIANRIGGLPDKVRSGVNGILCDPHNPDELGDALLKLSAEPREKLKEMGSKSAETAERKYSWQNVAEESVRVFSSLISK